MKAPAALPISVGVAGLFEFSTSGNADVQARLVDAAGTPIAEQQDRPDDWNIQLAAHLAPGVYRLELAPTGAESAATRVAMRAIAEREEPPLALPGSREVRPGDDVAVIPLAIPAGLPLLVVRAAADETVGLAVDYGDGDSWTTLRSELGRTQALELPLVVAPGGQPAARYRLRLWSLDRRGSAVRLAAAAVAPPRIAERDLARGARVAGRRGIGPAGCGRRDRARSPRPRCGSTPRRRGAPRGTSTGRWRPPTPPPPAARASGLPPTSPRARARRHSRARGWR